MTNELATIIDRQLDCGFSLVRQAGCGHETDALSTSSLRHISKHLTSDGYERISILLKRHNLPRRAIILRLFAFNAYRFLAFVFSCSFAMRLGPLLCDMTVRRSRSAR